MTDEHKKKIGIANRGVNSGTIFITNGETVKRIPPEQFEQYSALGYIKGRKTSTKVWVAWNKGKSMKIDERC